MFKNDSLWTRDQENMVDVAESHIPSQWVSVVSSRHNVVKHYHETKFWTNLNIMQKKKKKKKK